MTSPIAERLRRWPCKEEDHLSAWETMREAAAEIDALRLALAGAEERAETAAQKQFEAQDQGADFVLEALAKALGSPDWHPCDGTEEWEGDVIGTVYNILRAAKVFDPDTDELVTAKVTTLEARCAELEEGLKNAVPALAAAISLLENGGKKGAPSDKMFAQMLDDYRRHLAKARSAIAPAPGEGEKT